MATVESEGLEYKYIGATACVFKSRWRNHILSFKRTNMRHCTSLANTIHSIKDRKQEFTIKWQILRKASPYRPGSRECDLCLTESYAILKIIKWVEDDSTHIEYELGTVSFDLKTG